MGENVKITQAVLPEELVLGVSQFPCPGDDCNSDQGGCNGDANCGQDC